VDTAHFKFVDRLDSSTGYHDLTEIAGIISASDGGVIARDSVIQQLVPDNQVFTHFLLSEDDYVTYLSWPDDDDVATMFRERGIEWALLYKDRRWERDYHVWLTKTYAVEPAHYRRITYSPIVDQVYVGEVYLLYHLRPDGGRSAFASQAAPPGDER
jgi:hypothetical protein